MTSRQLDESQIFHVAREIPNVDARATYIDQVCGGDQALRDRVEALLDVHEKEQSFLKSNGDIQPTVGHTSVVESPGQTIGRYKLLQKVGEGGFGVVFMAQQLEPVKRRVALKVIKPGMDTKQVIARFEAERQALAIMDHPNIAKVLDAGETDSGRPYFVMELVQGVPITEYCDRNKLTAERRLQLFILACGAVEHAHQKGVIHRDIKPTNVLVTRQDGKPLPKVIDFGVAKAIGRELTEKTMFTAYGQMIGTPQYMSPEQAEMSAQDVDTRSDVYSLGVLLYELLTGLTPLDSNRLRTLGYAEMQRIIREEDAPRPSVRVSTLGERLTAIAQCRSTDPDRLRQILRSELDWIVMKSLDKERVRRYRSAAEFAEDVERYLNDDVVHACPPSPAYQLKKIYRRNRLLVTSALAISCAVVVGLAATTVGMVSAMKHSKTASIARKEADAARELAYQNEIRARNGETQAKAALERELEQKYAHAMVSACYAWDGGNLNRMDELLRVCMPEHRDAKDLRGFEWRYLWKRLQENSEALASQEVSEDNSLEINARAASLAYSPDGKRLYLVSRENGLVRHEVGSPSSAWEPVPLKPPLDRAPLGRIAFLGNSGELLVEASLSSHENELSYHALDLASGSSQELFSSPSRPKYISVSPDGKYIAVASGGFGSNDNVAPTLALYDASLGQAIWIRANDEQDDTVTDLAFSKDSQYVVSAGYATTVSVWDVKTGRRLHDLSHDAMAFLAKFSADGTRLYTFGDFGTKVWSVGDFRFIDFQVPQDGVSGLGPQIKRVGETSVIKDTRSTVRVMMGKEEWQTVARFSHRYQVGFALSPLETELATVDEYDGKLRIWDLDQRRLNLCRSNSDQWFKPLAISPTDGVFAVAGSGDKVRLWLPGTDQKIDLDGHTDTVLSLAFSSDGTSLVSGGKDNRIILWDVATNKGEEISRSQHQRGVWALALSRDGRRLASGDNRGGIRIWDLTSLTSVELSSPADQVYSLKFSVDDRQLAIGGYIVGDGRTDGHRRGGGVTAVWDFERNQWLKQFPLGGRVDSVAFSPDGKWLAAGDRSGQTTVWEVETMSKVFQRQVASAFVASIAFSPDSERLLSAADNGQIQICRLSDGEEVGRIQTPDNIHHIAFTPDGSGIGTDSSDGVVRLLKAAPWKQIDQDPNWQRPSVRLREPR